MVDELMLLSGTDIIFKEEQIILHQPTIEEIGFIGEEDFLLGCEFLNFNKEKLLSNQDKTYLSNISNFEIFMSILLDSDSDNQENTERVLNVLYLIFPQYEIQLTQQAIVLQQENQIPKTINAFNYEQFKGYIKEMFCLGKSKGKQDTFNPSGDKSSAIAKKLEDARRKKANKANDDAKKMNVLSRFMSILSVGQSIPLSEFNKYTIYQLYDAFDRYTLKSNFDTTFSARIAGATGIDDAENWMDDIHSL